MNLREAERNSIVQFVGQAAMDGYLSGRVLDYGCGKQPYREIVEAAGGEYHGFDRVKFPASVAEWTMGSAMCSLTTSGDAILCTQVVQYLPLAGAVQFDDRPSPTRTEPLEDTLRSFWLQTKGQNGHLVMTYPTNWPEVEPEDLHRFTKAGMERLLTEAGFEIVRHERRAAVLCGLAETPPNIEGTTIGRLEADRFALGYGVVARA